MEQRRRDKRKCGLTGERGKKERRREIHRHTYRYTGGKEGCKNGKSKIV